MTLKDLKQNTNLDCVRGSLCSQASFPSSNFVESLVGKLVRCQFSWSRACWGMPSLSCPLTVSYFHASQLQSIFYHHRMVLCSEEPVSNSTFPCSPSEPNVLSVRAALLKLNGNVIMFKLDFSGPCYQKCGSYLTTLGLQTCTQLYRTQFGILQPDDFLYLILRVVW